jgi:hypothetical protein
MLHTYVHTKHSGLAGWRIKWFSKKYQWQPAFSATRSSSGTLLLLSEADRLLDSPRELLCEHFVGLVRRQIQTVEARMRLGELRLFAGLLDSEATGSVGTLEILETVDGDTRGTCGELQEAGFLLGVPAADDL